MPPLSSLWLGYEPRGIPHILPSSAIPATEDWVRYLQKIREEAITCHNLTMQHMAACSFGKKFEPWKVGEKVWLSAKNLISALPSKKLAPKWYGPFTVEAVLSPITFKIRLSPSWKSHPVFHASELSSYQETEVHGPNNSEPPPDINNGQEEYEIEAVLAHKGNVKGSLLRSYSNRFGSEGLRPQLVCCAPFLSIAQYFRILSVSYPKIRMAIVAYLKVWMTIVWYPDVGTSIITYPKVRISIVFLSEGKD